MDNPVRDIIIGNIQGASGVQPNLVNTKATVTPNKVDVTQSLHSGITKAVPEPVNNSEICLPQSMLTQQQTCVQQSKPEHGGQGK